MYKNAKNNKNTNEVKKMRQIRTDLIYETVMERGDSSLSGITSKDITHSGVKVNRIEVLKEDAAQKIGRKVGKYATVFCPKLGDADGEELLNMTECISAQIEYLAPMENKTVLVAGLGNTGITSDALGPMAVGNILVSRHIKHNMAELFNSLNLGEIAAIAPGVLGQTGVESADIIKAVAEKIKPDVIIVIDSLMAGKVGRLAKTVQLSDTGITPGSGIGNHRFEISKDTMGIPVISMGIPMVIDAKTLAFDLIDNSEKVQKALSPFEENLVVTPKFVDTIVEKAARVLGYSINKAVHKGMTVEDMSALLA